MLLELTALTCLAVTAALFWRNPRRLTNRRIGYLGLAIVLWLGTVYCAVLWPTAQFGAATFIWTRVNAALSCTFPVFLWLLRNSLVDKSDSKPVGFFNRYGGLLWLACTCPIPFLDSFVFFNPLTSLRTRGPAYVVHMLLMSAGYIGLLKVALMDIARLRGIRRMEMRYLVINFSGAIVLSMIGVASGNIFESVELRRAGLMMFVLMYAIAGWSILGQKTIELADVVASLSLTLLIALLLGTASFALWLMSQRPTSSAIEVTIAFALLATATISVERKVRHWREMRTERLLSSAKRRVIELARTEPSEQNLHDRFEEFLCAESGARTCIFLGRNGSGFTAREIHLDSGGRAFAALCELAWATPESLQGRRSTSDLSELENFLELHSLGLLMTVPRRSPSPSLIVALANRSNYRPFSPSEVARLQTIAELMDNVLTHAHLAAQAALQAKVEHLALMSRGLAHDLKNLITPVSSFLIHTDGHFAPHTAAGEVHSIARRSIAVMTDYVREALFFADQLQPKFERVNANNIVSAVLEVTEEKAKTHNVTLAKKCDDLRPFVADRVLVQRMLANLVNNAIDASEPGDAVLITASAASDGSVCLQVLDTGSGILPENLAKIFEPYFTTKQFGEVVRGFGLGLTICQKIAHLHGGTIAVQSEPGRGTCFEVRLPLHQPASQHLTALDSALGHVQTGAAV